MTPTVSVQFNPRDIARVEKMLNKYRGASLATRLGKGTLGVARLMVNPIRDKTPVYASPPPGFIVGGTKRSVKARAMRMGRIGSGLVAGAKVGPTRTSMPTRAGGSAPLPPLIGGHRMVGHRPGLRDLGSHVSGNPFVDEAKRSHQGDAARIVSAELFKP